jgi:rhodanese-related sulfurtransferase
MTEPRFSLVNEVAPAGAAAAEHFRAKLSYETDPADLHADLAKGVSGILIVDARPARDFANEHILGAISLPHRAVDADSTKHISRDATIVAYCWGPGCNGSTKAALRLSALGFRVKELIGGLEYWKREGYPTETARD